MTFVVTSGFVWDGEGIGVGRIKGVRGKGRACR